MAKYEVLDHETQLPSVVLQHAGVTFSVSTGGRSDDAQNFVSG